MAYFSLLTAAFVLLLGSFVDAQTRPSAFLSPSGQISSHVTQATITPPPLGWSSWNSFSNRVNSKIVMQQAKAMVASGMQKAGYQYINIDEGWWLGERDVDGNIVVDPKQWPALQPGEHDGDMSNVVRFIHGLGLKAGIYTDAGESGCGFYGPDLGPPMPHTGSEGHYDQDFLQFAQWGFDYVKVDWCGGNKENLDPAVQYSAIAHAIARAEKQTQHPLYYSICNWGNNSPWTWAPGIGGVTADIWRTSGDMVAPIVADTPNANRLATFSGVLSNFDQGIHPEAQHTGFYNDPDMMVLGMPGLSDRQNRVHMSLWAISGAPLLVGADLTKLGPETVSILTNAEVVTVDQDPLGLQAIKVSEPGPGLQIWSKLLAAPGERAVLLLNRRATAADIAVSWNEIGLDPSKPAVIRNLWTRTEMQAASTYNASVPAGDALLFKFQGTEAAAETYAAASPANVLGGGAAPEACAPCQTGQVVSLGGARTLAFKVAPIVGPAFIKIRYLNSSKKWLPLELRVDGGMSANLVFPPGEPADQPTSITVEVESRQATQSSSLLFSSSDADGPMLESLSILSLKH